jgi:hypothetical protein
MPLTKACYKLGSGVWGQCSLPVLQKANMWQAGSVTGNN